MPRLIRIGLWLFALITLTGAVATLVSNEPILSQCSKSCWLNSLLLALFGETGARIGVALLWVSVAALFIFLGGKIKTRCRMSPNISVKRGLPTASAYLKH